MSGPNSDNIFQQTLDPIEQTVVEKLKNWLEANPHAEWKQSPQFNLVEQCSEMKLREILQQLAQVGLYYISQEKTYADRCRTTIVLLRFGRHTQAGNWIKESSFPYPTAKTATL